MFKKVMTIAICAISAVSLTACASGGALLDHVQNAMAENDIDINNVVEEFMPAVQEMLEENGLASPANQEAGAKEEETLIAQEPKEDAVVEVNGDNDTVTAVTKPEATDEKPDEPVGAIAKKDDNKDEDIKDTDVEEDATSDLSAKDDKDGEVLIDVDKEDETAEEETTEEETTEDETGKDQADKDDKDAADEKKEKDLKYEDAVAIELDKDTATFADDKEEVGTRKRGADVYISDDIIYYEDLDEYESGNEYGAGLKDEKHTEKEAAENKVLNIINPGEYRLSGTWNGQVRIDLGEDAKTDKDAKVTLILDDAEIECSVAPAILFENVYECDTEWVKTQEDILKEEALKESEKEDAAKEDITEEETKDETADEETAEEKTTKDETTEDETAKLGRDDNKEDVLDKDKDKEDEIPEISEFKPVDTKDAGAVIVIEAGSENVVKGSHVAEIYEDVKAETPERFVRQDGAIYSYMTMNIEGETDDGKDPLYGSLKVIADNEGIDTEVHLTINGGDISVFAEDDGINVNEDYVSVLTVNDGKVEIFAGNSGEGDGIDSNGWIVINGGEIVTSADPKADSGLDSDLGTYINGGSVISLGSDMNTPLKEGDAVVVELQFDDPKGATDDILITDLKGKTVFEFDPSENENIKEAKREYKSVIISAPELKTDESYYVFAGGKQQSYTDVKTGESYGGAFGIGGIFDDGPGRPEDRPDGGFSPFDRPENGGRDDFGVIEDDDFWFEEFFGNNDNSRDDFADLYEQGYEDAYYDIADEYFDDWYDSWFADSFSDFFEDHGIEMEEVEDYIQSNDISFGPDDINDIAKDAENIKDDKADTSKTDDKDVADEDDDKGSDIEDDVKTDTKKTDKENLEFELADKINSFTGISDAKDDKTSDETVNGADDEDADKAGSDKEEISDKEDDNKNDSEETTAKGNDKTDKEDKNDKEGLFDFYSIFDDDFEGEGDTGYAPFPNRNRIYKHIY